MQLLIWTFVLSTSFGRAFPEKGNEQMEAYFPWLQEWIETKCEVDLVVWPVFLDFSSLIPDLVVRPVFLDFSSLIPFIARLTL